MKQSECVVNKIESPEFIVGLRSDGILHVYYKSNTVIDVDIQEKVSKAAFELTGNKKCPCLFEAGDYCVLTKEARANAIKKESDFPATVSAVLVQNLAYKMIADFYNKVNKPKQPYKTFRKVEDAVTWLIENSKK
jgi:hypothetical protein